MKNIVLIKIILVSVYFISCTTASKQSDITISETKSDISIDLCEPLEYEEDYDEEVSQENYNRNKKKYIDLATKYLNIKKEDYNYEFSGIGELPDKKQTVVLISEYASSENKDITYDFSVYIRLLILNNETEKVIAQLKETIMLESDALIINGISLNTTPYELAPNTTAFSVEVMLETLGRASPYLGLSTYLFVAVDSQIINVVYNYSMYSHSTIWINEGIAENTTIHTHFTTSKEPSDTFRDIIVSSDTLIELREFDIEQDHVITHKANGKRILKYYNGKYH